MPSPLNKTPCLVCGKPTIRMSSIHKKCEAKEEESSIPSQSTLSSAEENKVTTSPKRPTPLMRLSNALKIGRHQDTITNFG